MRRTIFLLGVILLTAAPAAPQTPSQMFVFTLSGGFFFPSSPHFEDVYQTNSDLVWGVGACLPLGNMLFLTADMSWFNAEAFPGPVVDSSTSLHEKFIHLGLLDKQPFVGNLLLRFSAGFSYVTVTQDLSGPNSPAQSVEADRKIGYYGGIGMEHFLGDPHLSVFGDAVYDYRRSYRRELAGDFGGVRIIAGVHLYLY